MEGTPPGIINRKQSVISVIIGIVTAILHWIAQSKGIMAPPDAILNPGATGTAAAGLTAGYLLEKDSTKKK